MFVSGFIRQQLHVKVTDIGDQILDREETYYFTKSDEDPAEFSKPNFMFSFSDQSPEDLHLIWKKLKTSNEIV